ncbi:MAG: glycosyltransferase 87 family protein [Candidatus Dormibacteria bacterium]
MLTSPTTPPSPKPAPRTRAIIKPAHLIVAVLGLVVGIAVVAVPHLVLGHSYALAGDFRRYYAAARFLLAGGSPYDQRALLALEQHLHYLPPAVNHSTDGFVLLPFVLWPLLPLTTLPYGASFVVFTIIATVVLAASFAQLARGLGWSKWWIASLFGCLWWPAVWGRIVGQPDFLILAGLLLAAWLVSRDRPFSAGIAMVVIWIEPELAWITLPLLLSTVWHNRSARTRFLASWLGASAILFGIAALVPHGALVSWFASTVSFVHREAPHEYQLLGIVSIIQALRPSDYTGFGATAITTLAIAGAGAVGAALCAIKIRTWTVGGPLHRFELVSWKVFLPFGIWILASPYGHPNDAILLAPLVLLAAGPDAKNLLRSHYLAGLFCLFGAVTELSTGTIIFVDLMPLSTIALLISSMHVVGGGRGQAVPRLDRAGIPNVQ